MFHIVLKCSLPHGATMKRMQSMALGELEVILQITSLYIEYESY